MHLNRKMTTRSRKNHKEKHEKEISAPEVLEIIWGQVFPKDAEMRIRTAFEMLLNDSVIDRQDARKELC